MPKKIFKRAVRLLVGMVIACVALGTVAVGLGVGIVTGAFKKDDGPVRPGPDHVPATSLAGEQDGAAHNEHGVSVISETRGITADGVTVDKTHFADVGLRIRAGDMTKAEDLESSVTNGVSFTATFTQRFEQGQTVIQHPQYSLIDVTTGRSMVPTETKLQRDAPYVVTPDYPEGPTSPMLSTTFTSASGVYTMQPGHSYKIRMNGVVLTPGSTNGATGTSWDISQFTYHQGKGIELAQPQSTVATPISAFVFGADSKPAPTNDGVYRNAPSTAPSASPVGQAAQTTAAPRHVISG